MNKEQGSTEPCPEGNSLNHAVIVIVIIKNPLKVLGDKRSNG